jgi:hypothetical protein
VGYAFDTVSAAARLYSPQQQQTCWHRTAVDGNDTVLVDEDLNTAEDVSFNRPSVHTEPVNREGRVSQWFRLAERFNVAMVPYSVVGGSHGRLPHHPPAAFFLRPARGAGENVMGGYWVCYAQEVLEFCLSVIRPGRGRCKGVREPNELSPVRRRQNCKTSCGQQTQ